VELAEAFEMYDLEGSGIIPIAQLDLVLKTLGMTVPEANILSMKQRKIDEGDANVSFTELLHLVTHLHTEGEFEQIQIADRARALQDALSLFDQQGTGMISAVEFRKALRDTLKDAEIDALVRKADPQGTGRIAYMQLVAEMTGC
jgi:Ca2+-binding EF-hand superfamily protein